jgi:class 3 adenylate cyclase
VPYQKMPTSVVNDQFGVGNSGTAQPSDVPSAATTSPTARAPVSEAVGERRHVTVIFCDLMDSTGIAAKLNVRQSHP